MQSSNPLGPTSSTCAVDTAVKVVLLDGTTPVATLDPSAEGDNAPKLVIPVEVSSATFTSAPGIGGTRRTTTGFRDVVPSG